MTSLLQDTLYEMQCQAPSPSKDFHHLIITKKEVIWRSWRISVRPENREVPPAEVKRSHKDFLLEDIIHKQLQRIFGKSTLEYILNLCQGQYDFLVRMPKDLIVRILSFVGANDIKHVSATCRKFQKLCNSEEFWEKVAVPRAKNRIDVTKQGTGHVTPRGFNQRTGRPTWGLQRRRSTFF